MSSRLIVKNLPKHIKEPRLREIFGRHGEITQLKIFPSRKFAFVGYQTEGEAKTALRHLNESYIDTSKIDVTIAKSYGDESIPRAWSKFTAGTSAYQVRLQMKEDKEKLISNLQADKEKIARTEEFKQEQLESASAKIKREKEILQSLYAPTQEASELREFVDLMRTKKGANVWANDPTNISQRKSRVIARFEQVNAARPAVEGVKYVRQHLTFNDSDDEYQEIDGEQEDAKASEQQEITPTENAVAHDATISDADYFRMKMADEVQDEEPVTETAAATASTTTAATASSAKSDAKGTTSSSSKAKKTKKPSEADAESSTTTTATTATSSSGAFTVYLSGLPFRVTEDDITEFFAPLRPTDVRLMLNKEKKPSGLAYVDFGSESDRAKALEKNNTNIGDRYIEVQIDSKTRKDSKTLTKPGWEKKKEYPTAPPPESIADSGRIFVRNLSFKCAEDELRALFEKFGPVSEISMPIDSTTKKSKAIAFVTFLIPEHALKAFAALDGQIFQGRLLHLIPSNDKKREVQFEISESDSYSKKQAIKRKANSESTFNWNSLFLRSDTVADAMASSFNVQKADILLPETDASTAVRMALGETHIIAENKEFLRNNGVVLDAFDTRVAERSNTVILVKNIPFETTSDELRGMFGVHGQVGRVVLPPSHTVALVEFFEPTEAKKAFRALAYRKFKMEPLYLEWAPVGVFSTPPTVSNLDSSTVVKQEELKVEEPVEEEGEANATIFVKNLSFETTEDSLHRLFSKVGPVRSVSIATKKDPKNVGELLSMGFGFVEYQYRRHALEAMKTLQSSELDSHQIQIKLSTKASANEKPAKQGVVVKAKGTKLLVKNIAFEATKQEIREIFAAFGQVKSVRMPSKFDGSHRGFAFVDLLSEQEAKNAFESLSGSTHLYGRRLVIEWAKEDETVDSLREKANKYFDPTSSTKRRKVDDLFAEEEL